jgi:phosphatidylglycerol:prolipoprotein diacylglycerol transferase
MHPHLVNIPIFVICALGAGFCALAFSGELKRVGLMAAIVIGAGLFAGLFAYTQPWGHNTLPVQSYGTMILVGFLTGVALAARRVPQIGVEPKHAVDVGVWGVVIGLAGARLLHIVMNWPEYTPFENGFDVARVWKWFKLWETGLAFYGTFFTVIPFTWFYCRANKIPASPFLDIAVPALIAGQGFGRIGCFLFGCCYGKPCGLPWAVHFPPDSNAYKAHVADGLIARGASSSLGVHPTQLYAAVGAALTVAFLYSYWPRRRFDGQVLSLTLLMAGTLRFFEESLRDDEIAAFAPVPSFTLAHWMAIAVVLIGFALMFYFKRRGTLYKAA